MFAASPCLKHVGAHMEKCCTHEGLLQSEPATSVALHLHGLGWKEVRQYMMSSRAGRGAARTPTLA